MRTTESIMSATHASTLPVRNPRTGAIDDTLHVTPRAEIVSAAAELRRAQARLPDQREIADLLAARIKF